MAIRTDRPNAGVYRRQLIAMLDDDTADRIESDAAWADEPKAAVLRRYIALGIKRHDALERAKRRDAPAVVGLFPTLDGPAD